MKASNNQNPHLSFTIDDIEEMATNSSFERGEELFIDGDVQEITKTKNRFDAIVYGSQPYKVYLIEGADELNLNCSCLYRYEGICKHLVAFALKIVAGNFKEIKQNMKSTLSEKEFKSIYSRIEPKKKLLFLRQLLDRDNDLRHQFIAFSEDKTEKLDTIVGEKIEEVKSEINEILSNIDLDNLRYEYDNYDYGYRESWEVEYDTAIDEIKQEMNPYIDSINNYIRKGNLLDAFRILLGVYEGVQNLPDLDNDNCIFDGEYNNEVQAILKRNIRDISDTVSGVVKSDKAVLEIITLIFERISFYDHQDSLEEEEIIYSIKDFEVVFQTLVTTNEIANFVYQKLQENNLESLAASYILLNIAKVADNEKLWIKTAEDYANLDAKIAKQLLEKYNSKNAISDFNRIAKLAFNNWADEFDKYLVDHLDKEEQEDLFVKALKNYVSNKRDITHYRILKSYLTKEETLDFVDKCRDSYHTVFYVQLLEIEKRFEEIRACVYKNIDSYDIEKLLKPILNVYPSDCFEIIVRINNKAMNSYNRKRSTYETMVKTLKLLKDITSKKNETDVFLEGLYNHKPNLPALKDEMRKAKLIDF